MRNRSSSLTWLAGLLGLVVAVGCASEPPPPQREPVRPAPAPRSEPTPSSTPAPGPGVADARVVAIDPPSAPDLVLLSLGADDKVVAGERFAIRRGPEFIGEVVVEKVLRDSCGCRVAFVKKGEKIQAGDDAMRK